MFSRRNRQGFAVILYAGKTDRVFREVFPRKIVSSRFSFVSRYPDVTFPQTLARSSPITVTFSSITSVRIYFELIHYCFAMSNRRFESVGNRKFSIICVLNVKRTPYYVLRNRGCSVSFVAIFNPVCVGFKEYQSLRRTSVKFECSFSQTLVLFEIKFIMVFIFCSRHN